MIDRTAGLHDSELRTTFVVGGIKGCLPKVYSESEDGCADGDGDGMARWLCMCLVWIVYVPILSRLFCLCQSGLVGCANVVLLPRHTVLLLRG